MFNISRYKNKDIITFFKIYVTIFILVISGIVIVKNFKLNDRTIERTESIERIDSTDAYYKESDKTIEIGGLKYYLLYERESDKYLVYTNFNYYLGYIVLKDGEKIDRIDKTNLLERIENS